MSIMIPVDIRAFRHDGFKNIYEPDFCPNETRLYGTESLYGDWNGELLLLAKDFAPSNLIRERLARGESRPYHHTDSNSQELGRKTNIQLCRCVERFEINCGKLYGSAYACLLRDDNCGSGTLRTSAQIKWFIRRALLFTEAQMPNLNVIACLGEDAWKCATEAHDQPGLAWGAYRTARQSVTVVVPNERKIKLVAMRHPSRPYSLTDGDWAFLKTELTRGIP